jgi:DNA mismatch endonuclease (patch repair protein)
MAAIKGKDTKPELAVRKYLHGLGYRYRLHCKDLPGKPDIVLRKWKTVIFVNGCYWHRHENCKYAYLPKSNSEFWKKKFQETVRRDNNNYALLSNMGWKIIVVWECDIKRDPFCNGLDMEIKKGHGVSRLDC